MMHTKPKLLKVSPNVSKAKLAENYDSHRAGILAENRPTFCPKRHPLAGVHSLPVIGKTAILFTRKLDKNSPALT